MSAGESNRLQSRVLLPFARVVMLWAAAIVFVLFLISAGIAVLLSALSVRVPLLSEPAPPHVSSEEAAAKIDLPLEVEMQTARVDRDRLAAGDLLAVVQGATPYDPVRSVTILAGTDADKFSSGSTSGVAPGPAAPAALLPQAIEKPVRITATAAMVADLKANPGAAKVYRVQLQAAGDDGRHSERFELTVYFPSNVNSSANQAVQTVEPPAPPASDAEFAAQEVALIVDPARTPVFFEAYQRALRDIGSCQPNNGFAGELRGEIEANKAKLKRHSAFRFIATVCELWRVDVARAAMEEARRETALANAAMESLSARSGAYVAGYSAFGALVMFLMLALALALLAIENHVRVIRDMSLPK